MYNSMAQQLTQDINVSNITNYASRTILNTGNQFAIIQHKYLFLEDVVDEKKYRMW